MALKLQPSEFWGMDPRHFWWLVEALDPPKQKGPNFSAEERRELLDLLHEAKRKERV